MTSSQRACITSFVTLAAIAHVNSAAAREPERAPMRLTLVASSAHPPGDTFLAEASEIFAASPKIDARAPGEVPDQITRSGIELGVSAWGETQREQLEALMLDAQLEGILFARAAEAGGTEIFIYGPSGQQLGALTATPPTTTHTALKRCFGLLGPQVLAARQAHAAPNAHGQPSAPAELPTPPEARQVTQPKPRDDDRQLTGAEPPEKARAAEPQTETESPPTATRDEPPPVDPSPAAGVPEETNASVERASSARGGIRSRLGVGLWYIDATSTRPVRGFDGAVDVVQTREPGLSAAYRMEADDQDISADFSLRFAPKSGAQNAMFDASFSMFGSWPIARDTDFEILAGFQVQRMRDDWFYFTPIDLGAGLRVWLLANRRLQLRGHMSGKWLSAPFAGFGLAWEAGTSASLKLTDTIALTARYRYTRAAVDERTRPWDRLTTHSTDTLLEYCW